MSNTTIELSDVDQRAAETAYTAELSRLVRAGETAASSELLARGQILDLTPRAIQAELSATFRRLVEVKEAGKLPDQKTLDKAIVKADAAAEAAEQAIERAAGPLRKALADAQKAAQTARDAASAAKTSRQVLGKLLTSRQRAVLNAAGITIPSTE